MSQQQKQLDGSKFFRDQQGHDAVSIARGVEALEAYAGEPYVEVVPHITNCKLPGDLYEFVLPQVFDGYDTSILFIWNKRLFGLLDSQLCLDQFEDKPWEELQAEIEEVLWEITADACIEAIEKLYHKVHHVKPKVGEVVESILGHQILMPLTGDKSWLLREITEEEFVETLSLGALTLESEKDKQAILNHFQRIFSQEEKESLPKRQKLTVEDDEETETEEE